MTNLEGTSNFEGFYIEANQSENGLDIEILANEAGLRYLGHLIGKLVESNLDGKHFHLDKVTGLDGNIRSLILTRMSPPV